MLNYLAKLMAQSLHYSIKKIQYMCYQLKTQNGGTEAVIDDNCGITKFYAIADTLSRELKVQFQSDKKETVETMDWHFNYQGELLTLHYNIFNGVSIFSETNKNKSHESEVVMELAHFLEQKVY